MNAPATTTPEDPFLDYTIAGLLTRYPLAHILGHLAGGLELAIERTLANSPGALTLAEAEHARADARCLRHCLARLAPSSKQPRPATMLEASTSHVFEIPPPPEAMAGTPTYVLHLARDLQKATSLWAGRAIIGLDVEKIERWSLRQQIAAAAWACLQPEKDGDFPITLAMWWDQAPIQLRALVEEQNEPNVDMVQEALTPTVRAGVHEPSLNPRVLAMLPHLDRDVILAWRRQGAPASSEPMAALRLCDDTDPVVCAGELASVVYPAPGPAAVSRWTGEQRKEATRWARALFARTLITPRPALPPIPSVVAAFLSARDRPFDPTSLLIELQNTMRYVPAIETIAGWHPKDAEAIVGWLRHLRASRGRGVHDALLQEPAALKLWRRTACHSMLVYLPAKEVPEALSVVVFDMLFEIMPAPDFVAVEEWDPALLRRISDWVLEPTVTAPPTEIQRHLEQIKADRFYPSAEEIEGRLARRLSEVPDRITLRAWGGDVREEIRRWLDGAGDREPSEMHTWRMRHGVFLGEQERRQRCLDTIMAIAVVDAEEKRARTLPGLAVVEAWPDEDREEAFVWGGGAEAPLALRLWEQATFPLRARVEVRLDGAQPDKAPVATSAPDVSEDAAPTPATAALAEGEDRGAFGSHDFSVVHYEIRRVAGGDDLMIQVTFGERRPALDMAALAISRHPQSLEIGPLRVPSVVLDEICPEWARFRAERPAAPTLAIGWITGEFGAAEVGKMTSTELFIVQTLIEHTVGATAPTLWGEIRSVRESIVDGLPTDLEALRDLLRDMKNRGFVSTTPWPSNEETVWTLGSAFGHEAKRLLLQYQHAIATVGAVKGDDNHAIATGIVGALRALFDMDAILSRTFRVHQNALAYLTGVLQTYGALRTSDAAYDAFEEVAIFLGAEQRVVTVEAAGNATLEEALGHHRTAVTAEDAGPKALHAVDILRHWVEGNAEHAPAVCRAWLKKIGEINASR